ncbi:MAG: radical SAM protein [Clostridiales bacterium]|nr:radical SAM protein [Clostridiales bacterium]
MKTPFIFQIKRGSIDDGDGIRTVVFFKGCPLDCLWCHNPVSKNQYFEYSYTGKLCQNCGNCLDLCPYGALSSIGMQCTINELVSMVSEDITYYRVSGGGVTLSGGEPTLHMEFIGEFAKILRDKEISCAIETCGYFDFSAFKDLVLPYLDCILYDLKLIDPEEHKKYTGRDNLLILDNLRHLVKEEIRIIPRTPLIPGITDTESNLKGILLLLEELGLADNHLTLPYNDVQKNKIFIRPQVLLGFLNQKQI